NGPEVTKNLEDRMKNLSSTSKMMSSGGGGGGVSDILEPIIPSAEEALKRLVHTLVAVEESIIKTIEQGLKEILLEKLSFR
ncbi:hypothetical protein LCGC14_3050380, partial [marine sediment metagenome]